MLNINHISSLEEKTTLLKDALFEVDKSKKEWRNESKVLQQKLKEKDEENENLEKKLKEVIRENEKLKKEK